MLWVYKGLCAGLFLGCDFVDVFRWLLGNLTGAKLDKVLPRKLFCGKAVKLLCCFPLIPVSMLN